MYISIFKCIFIVHYKNQILSSFCKNMNVFEGKLCEDLYYRFDLQSASMQWQFSFHSFILVTIRTSKQFQRYISNLHEREGSFIGRPSRGSDLYSHGGTHKPDLCLSPAVHSSIFHSFILLSITDPISVSPTVIPTLL